MSEIIDLNRSHDIGQLALALSIAQGEITGAKKDSKNPFFKSDYADLASCWDACRVPLAKNKLAVIQTTGNDGDKVVITTHLVHESNQWIKGTLSVRPTKADPQAMGSAITYGRRYALSAMIGLAQVDDDGNAASGQDKGQQPIQESKPSAISLDKLIDGIEFFMEKNRTIADLDKWVTSKKEHIDKLSDIDKNKFNGHLKDTRAIMDGGVPEKELGPKLNLG